MLACMSSFLSSYLRFYFVAATCNEITLSSFCATCNRVRRPYYHGTVYELRNSDGARPIRIRQRAGLASVYQFCTDWNLGRKWADRLRHCRLSHLRYQSKWSQIFRPNFDVPNVLPPVRAAAGATAVSWYPKRCGSRLRVRLVRFP